MSRFGAKAKRLPGAEFTWETGPGGEADTAPTPLYPVCLFPLHIASIVLLSYLLLRHFHYE